MAVQRELSGSRESRECARARGSSHMPASTPSIAAPISTSSSIVAGPIAGRSKRKSWPGLAAFATIIPLPDDADAARRSAASVPSTASTGATTPSRTATALSDVETRRAARIGRRPGRDRCNCSGSGRDRPSGPACASASSSIGTGSITGIPSDSISRAIARSTASSLKRPIYASIAIARASGANESGEARARDTAGHRGFRSRRPFFRTSMIFAVRRP